MKKPIKVILSIFLLFIAWFIYYHYLGDRAARGRMNTINIQKIAIGMDSLEVRRIMGEPEARWTIDSEIHYSYDPGPGHESSARGIRFDSTGVVIRIFNYGE